MSRRRARLIVRADCAAAENLAIAHAPDGQHVLLQFELSSLRGEDLPSQQILLSPAQATALADEIWKLVSS